MPTDGGRLLRAVASGDNHAVPAYWTASRIANQIHRQILGPHGFTRRGRECERRAGGLRKTLTVVTRTISARPQVQLVAAVAVAGLPTPVTGHRRDSLGGTADTPTGRHHYALPSSADPLPADLLADAAGPVLAFLAAADDLAEFVVWALEVFAGQEQRGWWGRYRPVLPQSTGSLEAAAFAAAMLDDSDLVEFLTARVQTRHSTSTASTTSSPRSASCIRTCAGATRSSARRDSRRHRFVIAGNRRTTDRPAGARHRPTHAVTARSTWIAPHPPHESESILGGCLYSPCVISPRCGRHHRYAR